MSILNAFQIIIPPHPLDRLFFDSPEESFPEIEKLKEALEIDVRIQQHSFFKDKNIPKLVADTFGGQPKNFHRVNQGIKTIVSLAAQGYALTKNDFNSYVRDLNEILLGTERSRL